MPLSVAQSSACGRVRELVAVWFREPAPLSARAKLKLHQLHQHVSDVGAVPVGQRFKTPLVGGARPFDASRARFLDAELHHDPTAFLPTFEAIAYVEPRVLQREVPLKTNALRANRAALDRSRQRQRQRQLRAVGSPLPLGAVRRLVSLFPVALRRRWHRRRQRRQQQRCPRARLPRRAVARAASGG